MLAHDAVDAFPREKRHVSGITLGVSQATYDVLEAEIRAFKDRIVSIVNQDRESDRVCQFSVQLFPVSEAAVRDQNKEDA
jgi:uncharacterized protein (TIGR02147 family)